MLSLVGACATTTPPPQELTEARATFERVSTGPAAQANPAGVEEARKSLEKANKEFAEHPGAQHTRDQAYIAQRKAELAEAEGKIAMHTRQKEHADRMIQEAQSRQERELAEAQAKAKTPTEAVRHESVMFRTNRSTLLPEAKAKLDQVAETLSHNHEKLVVEGHADSRGSDHLNQGLSERRAQAVRDYLVSRGVAADRISAVGLSTSRPVADNHTPQGRASNRRADVVEQH